jgi:hypothetical protein
MYYITQNEKGLITGRYTSDIHWNSIPDDVIKVDEKIFNESMQMQRPALVNGELVEIPPEQPTQNRINELKLLLASTDFKVLPDYQQRSGKTDAEMAQILSDRKAWYDELKGLTK